MAAIALTAIAGQVTAGVPACPPQQPRVLLERFIPADLPDLLERGAAGPTPDREALLLDWIVPAPPGADAPLAAAALIESAPRAARDGRLEKDETLVQSHPLPVRTALSLEVQDGPALNGYIAMQMTVRFASRQALPAGLSAWMALVERIPAGEEESPVDRQLVRAVAGPLPLLHLEREPVRHLRAVRLPESGKPERLAAVGWVESDKGRVLAVGVPAVAGCPTK